MIDIHKKVFSIPKEELVNRSIQSFSPSEKAVFIFLIAVLIGSAFFILSRINQSLLIEVPREGGTVTEGVIGSPRFINPLLAASDADRDLTALVYSGLLKPTPEGGLIEDLAESYRISQDGLVYDFILKNGISFHDGKPVTADDIIFTIERAQDSSLKSPKRASWDGVSAQRVSEREIRFILKVPYAPFLENTALGILPKHIWKNADAEQFPFSNFNIEPIGSGPYKVRSISRNSSGVPSVYELAPFNKYALGKPYIKKIRMVFYPSEEALLKGYAGKTVRNINSVSYGKLKDLSNKNTRIERSVLPRIFAVFFNQNQAPIFSNKEVRRALDAAIDKKKIVEEVLGGYGTKIESPIPPGILKTQKGDLTANGEGEAGADKKSPREILESDGWEWNAEEEVWKKKTKTEEQRLDFSIATSNTPELKLAAEIIAGAWREIGIRVDLKIFDVGDLNQNVIRPRKFDSLLFGEIIGRELDLFAFWHSSQRNDPGLNIALYANITADKLLEEARGTRGRENREEKYREFEKEILSDIPAVFLYSPDFIYIVANDIEGLKIGLVTTPGERFINVHKWYIETDKVWGFFQNAD
jgi:peptide/nickel transport system substrate-binding protein